MAGNFAFRSATFGGFNRQDVVDYIEQTVHDYDTRLEQAQTEIQSLQSKNNSLMDSNEDLKNQMNDLRENIRQQMLALQNEVKAVVQERNNLRDDVVTKTDRITELERIIHDNDANNKKINQKIEKDYQDLFAASEKQNAEIANIKKMLEERDWKISDQKATIADLQDQVTRMKVDSDAYHAMCDSIGKIEMDMRYRTILMKKEAQEQINNKMAQARDAYDSIMSNANIDADAIRGQVDMHLIEIKNNVTSTSDSVNLALKTALAEVNRVEAMLKDLSGCLEEHVQAVNGIELQPITPVEAPPEITPIDEAIEPVYTNFPSEQSENSSQGE